MRTYLIVLCASLAATGCKKTGGGGGGGGGGGWLVGEAGLMENVSDDGAVGAGYDLGSDVSLSGIACRYQGEAWVVGAAGTLLYTKDAGSTWSAQAIPTTADLRAVATQDYGPVFLAGNGAFLTSPDSGATWTSLGDSSTNFRSVSAAQEAPTTLAISDDGGVWSYDGTKLVKLTTIAGLRTVAVSPDGELVVAVGAGIAKSTNAGSTWQSLAVDPSVVFDDVRIAEDGSAVAVGAGGAIATIDVNGAVDVQHVGTADLHAIHIADPDSDDATGFAVGDNGEVLISDDSGASWTMGPNVGRTVRGVDQIGFGHL